MLTLDDPEILRSVLEDLPTGVYVVGRNGKILLCAAPVERCSDSALRCPSAAPMV